TGALLSSTATSGTPLDPVTALVYCTTDSATQTTSTLSLHDALPIVEVTITVTPAPDLDEREQTFCEIDMATVADLNTAGGTGVLWYAAATGGPALDPGTALVDGTTYYATQTTADGCESVLRTALEVT